MNSPGSEAGIGHFALITLNFPPLGGGGTPRIAQTLKHLKGTDYVPSVYTAKTDSQAFSREFQEDQSQLLGLDGACHSIHRSDWRNGSAVLNAAEKVGLSKYLWAARYSKYYESERSWAMRAARQLVHNSRRGQCDLVFASAPPYSVLEAACYAAQRLRVPWVADMRDLWTQDTLRFYPSRWHHHWATRFERRLLSTASAVLANTPLSAERLRELLGDDGAERVFVLPNGFDEEDTPLSDAISANNSGVITILHAGTLYEPEIVESRLGRYRPLTVDRVARSFVPVLRGLSRLSQVDAAAASRVRLRFLGYVPDLGRELCADLGLSKQVRFDGIVPRGKAIEAAREADAQLLVQVAWADSGRPMPYVPGKVYDALATGKPILAPVGPGDLHDLLAIAPNAFVCDYRDLDEIAKALAALVRAGGAVTGAADRRRILAPFDRRLLTERLVRIFDWVLGRCSDKPAVEHWIRS